MRREGEGSKKAASGILLGLVAVLILSSGGVSSPRGIWLQMPSGDIRFSKPPPETTNDGPSLILSRPTQRIAAKEIPRTPRSTSSRTYETGRNSIQGEEGKEPEEIPDISRGDGERREMALTFDGGGWANVADEILDTLRERGVACTFFLTGDFIRSYPRLVRRIVAEGHEVANHTQTHPHLTSFGINHRHELLPGVNRRYLWNELQGAERLFQAVTGQKMVPFWRAPYGEHNAILRRWAWELGYRHVSWTSDRRAGMSLDSLDWVADPSQRLYCSSEVARDRILRYGKEVNGGIVLMHLGTSRSSDRIHERLGEIIEGLRERGYRLVKVSDLLRGREMQEVPSQTGD